MYLINKYKEMCDYGYYETGRNPKNPFEENFNKASVSLEFIKKYFEISKKDKVLELMFKEDFNNRGKHQHTVALFFLGNLLKRSIDCQLKRFLGQNVKNILGKQRITSENNLELNANTCNDGWYDFLYTWFLTCLYHDTASAIEEKAYQNQCMEFFLGANNVSHNLFQHKPILPYAKLFTYSEKLVRNYFNYRIDFGKSVDHGILGGFIMYDRLKKNYDIAWREFLNNEDNSINNCYEFFVYKERNWRIEHLDHFAIIADSIIAHNIWFSDDEKLYKHYGLNPLIKSNKNRIKLECRPLLFFLGMLDTIEPVKFFTEESKDKIKPVEVLENISIDLEGNNIINIEINNDFACECMREKWFEKIKSMKDWLNVSVCEKGSNFCNLTITIKCGIDNTGKHYT